MEYTIKADEVFLENNILTDAAVTVKDGKITAINEKPEGNVIDLCGLRLMPGFIDIHVHGGNGYDVMDCTYEALNEISKFKIEEGVTSFCPTTVTTTLEDTLRAIQAINEAMERGVDGAGIIGPFLEGPYINPNFKGAHPENKIRNIEKDEIAALINACKGVVSFAVAPEKPGALTLIKNLYDQKVNVRIGHSGATFEEAAAAINQGAAIAIHAYNAMSGLASREPGLLGAVMSNDAIYAEIICDMVHVHPASVKVLTKAKPKNKVILITDCMMAGGAADGMYNLGELAVKVEHSIARTLEGALAGSTLSIKQAVINMHTIVGEELLTTVNMATINPAKALGIDAFTGSIAVGKQADLIAVDYHYNVVFVMINGKILRNK